MLDKIYRIDTQFPALYWPIRPEFSIRHLSIPQLVIGFVMSRPETVIRADPFVGVRWLVDV